jgi:hypothetical protein
MSHRQQPLPGPLGLIEAIYPHIKSNNRPIKPANKFIKQDGFEISEDWYNELAAQRKEKYFTELEKTLQGPIPDIPHSVTEGIEQAGFVPLPYKYLGPGNSLNRGPAYNQIDSDAKAHDIEYYQIEKGEFSETIEASDKRFLQKAGDHIIEGISGKGSISDTIGAIAGGLGIGSKYLIEKAVGKNYYPSLSG